MGELFMADDAYYDKLLVEQDRLVVSLRNCGKLAEEAEKRDRRIDELKLLNRQILGVMKNKAKAGILSRIFWMRKHKKFEKESIGYELASLIAEEEPIRRLCLERKKMLEELQGEKMPDKSREYFTFRNVLLASALSGLFVFAPAGLIYKRICEQRKEAEKGDLPIGLQEIGEQEKEQKEVAQRLDEQRRSNQKAELGRKISFKRKYSFQQRDLNENGVLEVFYALNECGLNPSDDRLEDSKYFYSVDGNPLEIQLQHNLLDSIISSKINEESKKEDNWAKFRQEYAYYREDLDGNGIPESFYVIDGKRYFSSINGQNIEELVKEL